MRYRKLDANGDYTIGTGSDFHVNSPAAVGQAVLTRLRLNLGEWFLDTSDGTDWAGGVLGKYTDQTRDAVIKNRILTTQINGQLLVTSILNYSSSVKNRAFSVSASIMTIYGVTTISGTF